MQKEEMQKEKNAERKNSKKSSFVTSIPKQY